MLLNLYSLQYKQWGNISARWLYFTFDNKLPAHGGNFSTLAEEFPPQATQSFSTIDSYRQANN